MTNCSALLQHVIWKTKSLYSLNITGECLYFAITVKYCSFQIGRKPCRWLTTQWDLKCRLYWISSSFWHMGCSCVIYVAFWREWFFLRARLGGNTGKNSPGVLCWPDLKGALDRSLQNPRGLCSCMMYGCTHPLSACMAAHYPRLPLVACTGGSAEWGSGGLCALL